ncbi:flagellar basal body P-ring formation chaperone FlgA [Paraglaciecola aestuariivivens]
MNRLHYFQRLVVLLLINCCFYSTLTAAEENNLANTQLIKQVEEYVMGQLNPNNDKTLEISAMPIDSRLHIPQCPNSLTFSATPESLSQSNITVKAQCSAKDWYMFVLVKAVEIQAVVVMANAVSPGTLLSEDNLDIVYMDKKRLRMSTFSDIEQVTGARIKRRISPGRPVEAKNLCYVCKGDRVVISAAISGMQVKTSGIALEDGNMGETITVRNRRSNKKIMAKVASTGQVEIAI